MTAEERRRLVVESIDVERIAREVKHPRPWWARLLLTLERIEL